MSLLLSLFIDPAQAAWKSQTICVRHEPAFVDADSSYGDDLYTNNNPKDAIGIRIKLHLGSPTGTVVLDRYADSNGCITQLLDDGNQFHPRFISEYEPTTRGSTRSTARPSARTGCPSRRRPPSPSTGAWRTGRRPPTR